LDVPVVAAFVIGLFSSLHCVGMCGGIIGALTYSLPPRVRARKLRLAGYLTAYSAGRISSYALAGGLFGIAGASLVAAFGKAGHEFLQAAATLLMSAIGLYIGGWFPRLAQIERMGVPLWRRLEPLGRRLLPVRSLWQALAYGTIWGWLPCGMVYSMLLWSSSRHGAIDGMLAMVAFGFGTLPAVVGVGMVAAWFGRLARQPLTRKAAGLCLIAAAWAMFFLADRSFVI
jgi:sulfite exporter TauE/SafE